MELRLRLLGHRFVNLTCTGEGSKGSGSPLGLQGRLAQLEERLVCNQKAGGSNPPASTIPFWPRSQRVLFPKYTMLLRMKPFSIEFGDLFIQRIILDLSIQ